MALITKCIIAESEKNGGLRISIMSRHTYNDGITPRPELDGVCDDHFPQLAPSPKLIGEWIRREISWSYFVIGYENEMRSPIPMKLIKEIIRRARKQSVTVMCIEEDPENCHRKVFAEICKSISPSLEVIIK